MKGYFDHFAFKSITTEQFLGYLQDNLLNRFPGIVTRDQVNAWVFGPGLPADAVLPVTAMFQPVDEARTAWLAGKLQLKKLGADWVTQQWLYFLDNMPATLTLVQLADLDKAFGLTKNPNAEIAHSWFLLVIANDYQPSVPSPRGLLEYDRPPQAHRASVPGVDDDARRYGVCEARLRESACRISSANSRGGRGHRRSQSGVERMISEWMKVMLEEISRKKSEAEQARAEELMRRKDSERREEPQRQ